MTATRYPDMVSLEDAANTRRPVQYEALAPEPEEKAACPEYSDQELGAMVHMACDGWDTADIAYEIGDGVTSRQVAQALYQVRRKLGERAARPPRTKSTGRPCGWTAEQAEVVRRMEMDGKTIVETMAATGLSNFQVRYVRGHENGEA